MPPFRWTCRPLPKVMPSISYPAVLKNSAIRISLSTSAEKYTLPAAVQKVEIPAGTGFMQGIFVEYGITVDDEARGVRNGGFGSTS